jgi:pre-mRNA 3'-end-processing factor FIP1
LCSPGSKAARQKERESKASAEPSKPAKSGSSKKQETQRRGSSSAPTAVKTTLTHNGKEGKDFPEVRSSKVDVNDNPIWPANGKPITEIEIDSDLAEHSKPWRLPGTDQTDFFNYGFDEYTWVQYSLRQQQMGNTISGLKAEDAQLKAMFGEMGGPGAGGAGGQGGGPGGMPPMPPGMPGMPTPEQMQQMMAAGLVPPEFAQMLGMDGMGQQGQFGQGGGFQQGGGFGGQGQNGASPNPQPGQGFQPPSGPSGGGQQNQQQWMPPPGSENYSPQQLAIMQEQMGGGGGRGRGRGRRGGW